MEPFLQYLAAGGDLFTIGICIALYRIDRRLQRVELVQELRKEARH